MDVSNITRQISALRAQTAPDSITPEGLGSILQAIANLISELSNMDTSTGTNLIARVEQLEGDMQTALGNSQSAAAAAANMHIDSFELGDDNVTITVQQHGYSAMSLTLVAATTTTAGVMSAEDKDHLDKAYQRTLYQLTTSGYSDRVVLNYKRHNNQVVTVTFVGASSSAAGLMTAEDKVRLDNLYNSNSTYQQEVFQQLQDLDGAKADLTLNGVVSMLDLAQWPRNIIKSMTPGMSSVQGEVYLSAGMTVHDPIEMQVLIGNTRYPLGQPNEHTIYLARDTMKFCVWNPDLQMMEEVE